MTLQVDKMVWDGVCDVLQKHHKQLSPSQSAALLLRLAISILIECGLEKDVANFASRLIDQTIGFYKKGEK